jgi:hypothetical protein
MLGLFQRTANSNSAARLVKTSENDALTLIEAVLVIERFRSLDEGLRSLGNASRNNGSHLLSGT